ncbi:MAG TPA: hypothetical protein VIT91_09280 [Chthoniobacterales bacterium]
MKSVATDRFWRLYEALPLAIQRKARKAFRLWLKDHAHPSLEFKKVGKVWSARVDDDYRVVADVRGDTAYWFFIGTHQGYDRLLKQFRR